MSFPKHSLFLPLLYFRLHSSFLSSFSFSHEFTRTNAVSVRERCVERGKKSEGKMGGRKKRMKRKEKKREK